MLSELVATGRRQLSKVPFEASTREATLLLGHVLALSEAQVVARSNDEVSQSDERAFRSLLDRRLRGEPVAYLIGEREFFGRSFRVDPRVLIPRPETEHLVETVLALPLGKNPRILDLCTGSGCIAVTLALEHSGSSILAGDISTAALGVASHNAKQLGAQNVRFLASDLARSVAVENFDIVVANPPYIDRRETASLSIEIRDFEPDRALFVEGDPDAMMQRLVGELDGLRSGSFLVFEIGHLQGHRAERILASSLFTLERFVEDYQGIPRVVVARRK